MGRNTIAVAKVAVENEKAIEAEVGELVQKPHNMPDDVWNLVQENGRLATERLNELLASPKFTRLRASEQARLIALAQNRAYGTPVSNRAADTKRSGKMGDVVASELSNLVHRATLPEYKNVIVDVEFETDD